MAIRCMEPPTPHERLILGRKYGIDEWIPLALEELCERSQPLTPDEARLMDFEDVVLVGSVREKVRNQARMVNSAEICDCIEALRRGEPWTMPPGRSRSVTPVSRSVTPPSPLFGTTASTFGAVPGGTPVASNFGWGGRY